MNKLAASLMLFAMVGCYGSGSGTSTATPPPANKPVSSDPPKAKNPAEQQVNESQGIGIAPEK